ncbi:MAG: acyl-CoA thioesterase [Paludibacteraceae bacterium]|nr:acyl-CoA thioesterase [Paludibacteraceae bacterium]
MTQTRVAKLTNVIRHQVPFFEVDAIQMVWHGNYVKYLELGREAFGRQFGLAYMRIFENGYVVPVVDLHLSYKKNARLDDVLRIETTYVPTEAAKLMFEYAVYRDSDNELILTASSTQLFVTNEGEFELSTPEFIRQWRAQWL